MHRLAAGQVESLLDESLRIQGGRDWIGPPKYVSAAFGSLDLPWKLGPPPLRLRRHLLPHVQTPKHHRRYLPRPDPWT
jgi:hypothetical protein